MRKSVIAFHLSITSTVLHKTLLDKWKFMAIQFLRQVSFRKKKKTQYIINSYILGLAKTLAPSVLLTKSGTHQVGKPFNWLVERGCGLDWNLLVVFAEHHHIVYFVLPYVQDASVLRRVFQASLYLSWFFPDTSRSTTCTLVVLNCLHYPERRAVTPCQSHKTDTKFIFFFTGAMDWMFVSSQIHLLKP